MPPKAPSGFCFPFDVRETADKGLGVFAAVPVRRGSIVWRHVPGNYTVYDQAAFLSAIKDKTHDEAVYELTHLFGLRGIADCVIRIHDEGALINHACPANLATDDVQPVREPADPAADRYIRDVTAALLGDRYALVATRDIGAGEEFTTDYAAECDEPAWFYAVYDQYGIVEDYMDVG
jgi:hypothetical protein